MSGWSPMQTWLIVGKGDWRKGVQKLASSKVPQPPEKPEVVEGNTGATIVWVIGAVIVWVAVFLIYVLTK
jgi:hypothetical protein